MCYLTMHSTHFIYGYMTLEAPPVAVQRGGMRRGGVKPLQGANIACKSISTTSIGWGGYIFDPGQQYPPPPPAPHI